MILGLSYYFFPCRTTKFYEGSSTIKQSRRSNAFLWEYDFDSMAVFYNTGRTIRSVFAERIQKYRNYHDNQKVLDFDGSRIIFRLSDIDTLKTFENKISTDSEYDLSFGEAGVYHKICPSYCKLRMIYYVKSPEPSHEVKYWLLGKSGRYYTKEIHSFYLTRKGQKYRSCEFRWGSSEPYAMETLH